MEEEDECSLTQESQLEEDCSHEPVAQFLLPCLEWESLKELQNGDPGISAFMNYLQGELTAEEMESSAYCGGRDIICLLMMVCCTECGIERMV